jgi:hypothetical protein
MDRQPSAPGASAICEGSGNLSFEGTLSVEVTLSFEVTCLTLA